MTISAVILEILVKYRSVQNWLTSNPTSGDLLQEAAHPIFSNTAGAAERISEDLAMAFLEDDRPKLKRMHEIGQDVTLLSVGDLDERIALLKAEIMRLEAAIDDRRRSRSIADSVFKT
jgi:uncharacterized small protein (DUF1192 family)